MQDNSRILTWVFIIAALASAAAVIIAALIISNKDDQSQPIATISNPVVDIGKIIFHSDRDYIGQIYMISQDSNDAKRLTSVVHP